MPFPLSPQVIDALVEVITGGSANDSSPPIGVYRSGPKIERFMRACNVEFQIIGSRVPALIECLSRINNDADAKNILSRVIEASSDPRDFINDPERHNAVVQYLNRALSYDGFELRLAGSRMRLLEAGKSTPVLERLSGIAEVISFDTVQRDLDRSLNSSRSDPEDAVTAACSTIESVCRSILIELGEPLPDKKDVMGLYNVVRKPLGLSPGRSDIDPLIADDVRKVLSGLHTVIQGVGALRTHGGDAHGRERGFARIDERIANLAIHSASTASLFLIETWQKKFPTHPLRRHDEDN